MPSQAASCGGITDVGTGPSCTRAPGVAAVKVHPSNADDRRVNDAPRTLQPSAADDFGRAALGRLLSLLCDQLGLATATVLDRNGHPGLDDVAVGTSLAMPRASSALIDRAVTGELVLVAGGQGPAPDDGTGGDGGTVVAAAVRDERGSVIGVIVGADPLPHREFDDRDRAALGGVAHVAGPLLQAGLTNPTALAAHQLAEVVSAAQDVEQLTRPLLDALHQVSGMASTYLTRVENDEQSVLYSLNSQEQRGFVIPEGVHVPWEQSLCQRSLTENRPFVDDVPAVWPESEAAAALGIRSSVSVPVRLSSGELWGTLCGADDVSRPQSASHLPLLKLFSRLIAAEVERSAAVHQAQEDAAVARRQASTDALTGCATRVTVEPWLLEALGRLGREEVVATLFVDVDAFTLVNDRHGHATGDAVLAALGDRLRSVGRADDLVARIGGDEFLVAVVLPRSSVASLTNRVQGAADFDLDHAGHVISIRCSVGCAISDEASDPTTLVAVADVEMYREKALHGR